MQELHIHIYWRGIPGILNRVGYLPLGIKLLSLSSVLFAVHMFYFYVALGVVGSTNVSYILEGFPPLSVLLGLIKVRGLLFLSVLLHLIEELIKKQ